MKHVNAIRKDIEAGDTSEAHDALDNLLSLGPSNTSALKLRALLFRTEGRFREESKVWDRVIDIDNEDVDAIEFYQNQQLEDRELFYFTEDLPQGGRRYFAYPRGVITTALFAVMGSFSFWIMQTKMHLLPTEQQAIAEYSSFLFLVLIPMCVWLYQYLKALKYIDLTEKGMVIKSQIKTIEIPWEEVVHACLRFNPDPNNPDLNISLIPIDEKKPHILIDMNEQSSSVRARTYLLSELERYIENFGNVSEEDMPESKQRFLRF